MANAARDRRALIEAVRSIPARERAWLQSDDPDLFAFYGLGIVLNSAQREEINKVLTWPPGTGHVWQWANRTGKTGGLVNLHAYCLWKKWRYLNPDPEGWQRFLYKTLHACPLNRLMGKAWETADAIFNGSSEMQRSPITHLQRKAFLAPFFNAGKGANPDGSDALFIKCANGSKTDFLSTSDGAGRLESDEWWLLVWDEFPRQQPVTDVPILIDQTFLPRAASLSAPIVLAGTDTEDFDPVYAELEEMAADNPKDWNFSHYAREVNFTQTRASIDRQRRMSFDKATAARSLDGESGEGGRGTLFPTFLLNNAFTETLPNSSLGPTTPPELRVQRDEIVVSAFDHALAGDLNVVRSWALPWPVPPDTKQLIGRVRGISADDRRSSTTLTPDLQFRFVADHVDKNHSRFLIVDASGEGGISVYRKCKVEGLPVVPFNFTARPHGVKPGLRTTNKEYGLQWLQKILGWGLDLQASENGWIADWPEISDAFGLLRVPAEWRRDRRELAVLRRDDANLKQDRAMVYVMLAGWLARYVDHSRPAKSQPFNIMATRPRPFIQQRVLR